MQSAVTEESAAAFVRCLIIIEVCPYNTFVILIGSSFIPIRILPYASLLTSSLSSDQ